MLSMAEIQMLAYANVAAQVRTSLKPESNTQAVERTFGRDRSWRQVRSLDQQKAEIRDIRYN